MTERYFSGIPKEYMDSDGPFALEFRMDPEKPTGKPVIGIMDDDGNTMSALQNYLTYVHGYPTIAFLINQRKALRGEALEEQAMSMANKCAIMVCDKSFGVTNGPDFIEALTMYTLTIMYTGEWETRETNQRATRFIPMRGNSLPILMATIEEFRQQLENLRKN